MGQLEDMQVFIRVVEAGGVGRAAQQMGLAKSAVSRRLSDLEARLGITLITRTTRTSNITEAGTLYYNRALQIIDDIAELNVLTSDPQTALTGTLRLAAPLSFGLSHLSSALDLFTKKHPDLTLQVDFSDSHIDLVEGGYDLAFRIGDLRDSSLKARSISPIHFSITASPDYLKQCGTPRTAEDLKSHKILRYSLADSNNWKLKDNNNKEVIVPIQAKIQANNGDFLCTMAVAGHGLLLSPTFITWEALACGDLVPVLEHYTVPSIRAYAVYPQTRFLSQRARLLIDHLVETFGENPYWDQCLAL